MRKGNTVETVRDLSEVWDRVQIEKISNSH